LPGARPCTSHFARMRPTPSRGEMLAFVPPSLLEFRWAEDVLRFELEPDPDPDPDRASSACVLRLTVTFPEHGKAARDCRRLARLSRAAGLCLRRQ